MVKESAKLANFVIAAGLNPCLVGRWSRSRARIVGRTHGQGVLILVWLEDGQGGLSFEGWRPLAKVLILVWLEDGQGDVRRRRKECGSKVLILVWLEDGQGVVQLVRNYRPCVVLIVVWLEDGQGELKTSSKVTLTACLNPCLVGRWSRSSSTEIGGKIISTVLILVWLEDGQGEHTAKLPIFQHFSH